MKKIEEVEKQGEIVEYEIQYLKAEILKLRNMDEVKSALIERLNSIEIKIIDLNDIISKLVEIYK